MKQTIIATLLQLPNLGINDIQIPFVVYKHIAGQQIPRLVGSVSEASFMVCLYETKSCHIGVYHHLRGRTSILNQSLFKDGHNRTTAKTSKAIKRIRCVIKKSVVPK